ncbi:MAG TPA: site-specific DNA-methyltransferase [Candidatus Bacteroides avicola]|uniref:site-specific DNA-methyltransferase (adenine-specific) n=1 Tax=Candidatus Bacteroides avicola TaxID=2838468 RepID=A0A9D2HYY8_9BACE|nr:site-specific DNA-methyltransferase [Candidatus Bacteroides avicola]
MEQPKHIDMQTPNGAELNLEALYKIAPSCFTEAKGDDGEVRHVVDFNKLRLLLGDNAVEDAPEVYDFTWVGKRAALQEAATPIRKTLRPCLEESVDWDKTQNLYIEGDNLEVLKLLQNSYMGKVKMIYIDPPYNTGNDFVYHDDFHRTQEEEDEAAGVINEVGERMIKNTESNGKFHSDWCSMIYSRLMIARSLLSEDGFIFISIDDNENENLRKICDEVFGSQNFKSQSIIINNRGGRDYGGIALQHDYILIYSKSDLSILNLINEKDKEFQYYDEKGGFNLMELRNRNVKFNDQNRPNLCYPFYVNPQKKDKNGLMEIALEPMPGFVEVYPAKSNGIQTV